MKLSINPLLPIGNYLNKRYGIEMDFPDDSNPLDNFKYLNDVITAVHMAEYPLCYKDGKPLFSNYQGEEETEKQVERKPESPVHSMIQAITTCTEVATLKTFEKLAKSKPEFQTAYNNRLKELQP